MHDAAATDVLTGFDHMQDVGDHAGIQQAVGSINSNQSPVAAATPVLRGFVGGVIVHDDDFMGKTRFFVGADGFLDGI